jgi:hypothetical protein
VGVVQTVESFSFKSNGIGNVRGLTKWVHGLSTISGLLSLAEGKSRCNSVSEVGFSLSLEAAGDSSTVVLEAASEGSEETSSFLVGLLEEHAVIVALDLHGCDLLLLLLHHGLLLEKRLLLLDQHGLFNDLNVFSLLVGIGLTDVVCSKALGSVAGHLVGFENASSGGALQESGRSLHSAGRALVENSRGSLRLIYS